MPTSPRRGSLVLVACAAAVAVCIAACGESPATPAGPVSSKPAPTPARRVASPQPDVAAKVPVAPPADTLPPLPELDEKGRAALAVLRAEDSNPAALHEAVLDLVAAGDAGVVGVAPFVEHTRFDREAAKVLRAHGVKAVPILIRMVDRATTLKEWLVPVEALQAIHVAWARSPIAADVAAAHLSAAQRLGRRDPRGAADVLSDALEGASSASAIIWAALPAPRETPLWFLSPHLGLRADDPISARAALNCLGDNDLARCSIAALGDAAELPPEIEAELIARASDPESPIRLRALSALARRAALDGKADSLVRTTLASGASDTRSTILRTWERQLTDRWEYAEYWFQLSDETIRAAGAQLNAEDETVRTAAESLFRLMIGSAGKPDHQAASRLECIAHLMPEPAASKFRAELTAGLAPPSPAAIADGAPDAPVAAAENAAESSDELDPFFLRWKAERELTLAGAPEALNGSWPALRRRAAVLLAESEERLDLDVSARLRSMAMYDPHPLPRVFAAAALVLHGATDDDLVNAVDRALRTPPPGHDEQRDVAIIARALRRLGAGTARFTETLEIALSRSRNEWEQRELIETIAEIGPAARAAVPTLRTAVDTWGLPVDGCEISLRDEIRIAAVKALGAIGRDAAPAIADLRRVERDPVVAEHVRVAIAQIEGAGR